MNINDLHALTLQKFHGKRFPAGILPNAQTSTIEGTLAITWKWFLDILGKTNL